MDNTIDRLNKEFFSQDFETEQPYGAMLDSYQSMARNSARMEHAIAVLSDLRTNTSYLYYGKFAQTLGIDKCGHEERIPSIWEKDIFRLIHPDDLVDKHVQELCFFHFIKKQPPAKRTDYYLTSKLRMKNGPNSYLPVLHRMFYIPGRSNGSLWLALCLYSPLWTDLPAQCLFINSVNGQTEVWEQAHHTEILSQREKQVLSLIDKGLTSKEIAKTFTISIHTVNRHRQEILGKLQVKNSIEACRVAKHLKLIG